MKKPIYFILIFIINLWICQGQESNSYVPSDPDLINGKLKNGLTYYIYKTDVNKDVASYYIVQNVGSILEEDDQQGLAHFLEHMAFNGTKNFPDKSLLNTLQKHGALFGKDINAYTSFEETVYNMNNIPVGEKLVDTCLLMLHDWSNYISLKEKEIDAERGVIKEEWRTRENGNMRIFQQTLPTMFNHTKYANRMPIGSMDVIDNFDYQTLRDFYNNWYRTDLQAIVVIGDIDPVETESKIKNLFSKIPIKENAPHRYNIEIPENENILYKLAKDDEITTSNLNFGIRHPRQSNPKSISAFKESLINMISASMVNDRLEEINQNPEAPFLSARIGYGEYSRTTNSLSLRISPKPNRQQEAFSTAYKELIRAVKHGFTPEELDRIKEGFNNSYQQRISTFEDRNHYQIFSGIKDNFLENKPVADLKKEYQIVQNIFDTLSTKDLNVALKKLYTPKNRFLIVTGVENEENLSKEQAIKTILELEEDESIQPYQDKFGDKTLFSGIKFEEGTIENTIPNENINATQLTLSNGIKVYYKFQDKTKEEVLLRAISYGGLSKVPDEDFPSAYLTLFVTQNSGLGDYSNTDLNKLLPGSSARTGIKLEDHEEMIYGSSTLKDLETLLQMVHLRFAKPRFSTDAFAVSMENLKNFIRNRREMVNEKIKDSLSISLYGPNSARNPILDSTFSEKVSFDKIKSIYKERFNDPSDFDFYIVGDVELDTLRPLLEKYIASIPTNHTAEQEKWNDIPDNWIKKDINKVIPIEMEEPKSSVRIGYRKKKEFTLRNKFLADIVKDILTLRFTETLREDEGGTYGARTMVTYKQIPHGEINLEIAFDCNPDKVNELKKIVEKEILQISNGSIRSEDIQKTISNYKKERKQELNLNQFYLNQLVKYYREGYDIDDPENFEEILNDIDAEDISRFARDLFHDSWKYKLTFIPKKITDS